MNSEVGNRVGGYDRESLLYGSSSSSSSGGDNGSGGDDNGGSGGGRGGSRGGENKNAMCIRGKDGVILWREDDMRTHIYVEDGSNGDDNGNDNIDADVDTDTDTDHEMDFEDPDANTLADGGTSTALTRIVSKKNKTRHNNNNNKLKSKSSSAPSPSPTGHGWEDEWDKARIALPPFSSLSWVDRQLVKEWRTCDYLTYRGDDDDDDDDDDDKHINVNGAVDGDGVEENKNGAEQSNQETDLSQDDLDMNIHMDTDTDIHMDTEMDMDMDTDMDTKAFEQARTLLPQPIQKPPWENASSCYQCRSRFGSKLRHHCRLCGRSYCQTHSRWSHRLPHLGYSPDVPERVCAQCKQVLESQNLAERIAWRMARCRDFLLQECEREHDRNEGNEGSSTHAKRKGGAHRYQFCPYFDTGLDTVEDAAARLTKAAIHMAKSIPLGAQATMTVETLDVLRKHGLKGVYGLILRKEFMAAADLLCKVTGINKKVWPLSVHELSAAIFYALAQHRALRGVDPDREHRIHALKEVEVEVEVEEANDDVGFSVGANAIDNVEHHSKPIAVPSSSGVANVDGTEVSVSDVPALLESSRNVLVDETDDYNPAIERTDVEEPLLNNRKRVGQVKESKVEDKAKGPAKTINDDCQQDLPFDPVCEPVSDSLLASLIFFAPLALNFIYATSEVDMQLLAAQQGWTLMYAHLKQDDGTWGGQVADKPAAALFVHSEQKIACFAVRGTATINDVVTDIRAMPIQFPDSEMDGVHKIRSQNDMDEEGWTPVSKGQGLALCGMAGAACNLFRENIDAILLLARQGYKIRLTGHSLGGSCAALLGSLVKRHFEFHLPSIMSKDEDILRVYSYGSPACVDAKLSDAQSSYVTNCVLHDDIIPRLTPTSIRALLKHLLYIRETWVKTHLNEDLMAITARAKTVVRIVISNLDCDLSIMY